MIIIAIFESILSRRGENIMVFTYIKISATGTPPINLVSTLTTHNVGVGGSANVINSQLTLPNLLISNLLSQNN